MEGFGEGEGGPVPVEGSARWVRGREEGEEERPKDKGRKVYGGRRQEREW